MQGAPSRHKQLHYEPLDHHRLDLGALSSVIHQPTWWQVGCILACGVLWTWSENSSLYINFFNIQTVSVCRQTSTKTHCNNICIFNLDGFFFYIYNWTVRVNLDHMFKSKMMYCVHAYLKGSTHADDRFFHYQDRLCSLTNVLNINPK